MAPDRKPLAGRPRGKGKGRDQGFREEESSHADRAAELLARARASSSAAAAAAAPQADTPPAAPRPAAGRTSTGGDAVPLPGLIKSLVNPQLGNDSMTIKEAIPIAGKLARAKLNTPERLALLNSILLEEAGISSELERHKILIAFGIRRVGSSKEVADKGKSRSALDLLSAKGSAGNKRRRVIDDEALSREYGNISAPKHEAGEGDEIDYIFNEVLDEEVIKNRRAVINRAPIMTAWATIVLEKLGFQRREALSLAHCYVNTTSTARGISLGIIPASERQRSVNVIGSNQPHFELMGVKIPLMKVGKMQEWRGISQGQVVGPDNAFGYMKRSMHQTLPVIIGSLMLLADSYTSNTRYKSEDDGGEGHHQEDDFYQPGSGPDLLHANAYDLYTKFRPETAGEWGKKSTFHCGKALALRRGRDSEAELRHWDQSQDGEQGNAQEIKAFERELQAFAHEAGLSVKEEPLPEDMVKVET